MECLVSSLTTIYDFLGILSRKNLISMAITIQTYQGSDIAGIVKHFTCLLA